MYHVRTTKTASKATAVQVVTYSSRKKIIVKHIGSAHTPQAIATLKQVARSWIEQETLKYQQPLFPRQIKQQQRGHLYVAYDVFEGNTFEGKTFIPTITKFKETNKVKTIRH